MKVRFQVGSGPHEAREVTSDQTELQAVAQWCSGSITTPAPGTYTLTLPDGSSGSVGSWVVQLAKAYRIFTGPDFEELFEPLPHSGERHAEDAGRPAQSHRQEQSKPQQEQHVRHSDERAAEGRQAQARHEPANRQAPRR